MFFSNRKTKAFIITLSLTFILLLNSLPIYGAGLSIEAAKPRIGMVIDVIDGEAIEVLYITSYTSKAETELIKLIGINSESRDETYEFVKEQLLGRPVFVVYDGAELPIANEFTNAYVYLNTDESFNETLLKYGYALLDETYSNATYYQQLRTNEIFAKRQEKGIHKTSETAVNIMNINLAPADFIMEHFDISSSAANAIINYRRVNTINSSVELGFIDDTFDRSFIEQYRSSIHYITNINDATIYELTSLFNSYDALDKAYEINRARIFMPFSSVAALKGIESLSSDYDKISRFLTSTINDNYFVDKTLKRANINTATSSEIATATGLTDYLASKIVLFRTSNNYNFRSLMEIAKVQFPLQYMNLNSISEHLGFETDINTANDFELSTLFSKFSFTTTQKNVMVTKLKNSRPFYSYSQLEEAIGRSLYKTLEPVMVLSGVNKTSLLAPINVNSAKPIDVANYLKLTGDERAVALNHPSSYYTPEAVKFRTAENQHLITLYTNINHASYMELLYMNGLMTKEFANKLIEYRSYYPFYNLAEVKAFFVKEEQEDLYEKIKDYIVFY